MKKINLILLIIIISQFLTNCSNDSDSTSTNKAYCNITVNGVITNHEYDEGFTFSFGDSNCTTNFSQRLQSVGQFENTSYILDFYFVHTEDLINFQGYNIANTSVKNKGLDIVNPECYNNFDFIAEYTDKSNDNILTFDTTSNNTNIIQSITLFREDALEKVYAVKGNFNVTYKKPDNNLIQVTGDYKTYIYVLK
jgi:hypothetical protein